MAERSRTDDGVHVIDDVSGMRALFDPLRLRLMHELTTPKTAKELGESLGVEPNKLYYHLRRLEQHGFVQTDRTGTERLYRASAERITVDPTLRPKGADASGLVDVVFGEARRQIHDAISKSDGGSASTSVSISHVAATLSPPKLARYRARLRQLVQDLDSEPASTAKGAVTCSLLVALFPTAGE